MRHPFLYDTSARRNGIRLVCPADPEWPGLDELGLARPYALWLRGDADLGLACLRSVSMVGSRVANGYGARGLRDHRRPRRARMDDRLGQRLEH
jgi:predicted Rossmann fold nucleotide-binding protein DprA/Smf involved in DNA uptake